MFCKSCFGLFQLVSAYSFSQNTIESAETSRLFHQPNQPKVQSKGNGGLDAVGNSNSERARSYQQMEWIGTMEGPATSIRLVGKTADANADLL
jgi:hypothetical protein